VLLVYSRFENLIFDIFCKKRLFQIKTALTFTYGLEKKHVIYENVSTEKVTSNFTQIFDSQNSKGKYESRKILDFARKMRKNDFLKDFLIYFIISSTF
jgi:hypothetical protein